VILQRGPDRVQVLVGGALGVHAPSRAERCRRPT
jgi:hypothetical protein